MKKKAIEKIPYLTAGKAPKKYKFVARTDVKKIDSEKHLFLEVYENVKAKLKTPVVRVILTKKDYGTYYPETEFWSGCRLENEYYRLIWESSGARKRTSETYMAEDEKAEVWKFCGENSESWQNKYRTWADVIISAQDNINRQRRQRTEDNKQAKLEARCQDMPELPAGFEDWYKNTLFRNCNYIYYRRKGRYATFTCSCCGEGYTYATEPKQTFEGQFEHVVQVPRQGQKSACEKCGAVGHYKTAGNAKDVYGMEMHCYIGQPFRETGAVIRYMHVEKIFEIGKPERYIVNEVMRVFFEEGKKAQRDYHLYSNYQGKTFWNYVGYGCVSSKSARIYPETFAALKGTILQYSGIEEYAKHYDYVELVEYMTQYQLHPSLEMITKMGMYKLTDCIVNREYGASLDYGARTPWGLLKISKDKLKLLCTWNGDKDMLKILQLENSGGYSFSEEECEKLLEIHPGSDRFGIMMRHMTLTQFLNRVEKYSGAEFGSGCTRAEDALKHTSTTYLDYLQMRCGLGYDMSRSTYLFPKDLEAAHRKMIMEIDKKNVDKRIAEVEAKFADIRKNYRKLRNRYFYEDENYVIRPARSAKEIVLEGRILHHCVGGDGYLRGHNRGERIILMLRFADKAEEPYITVEIDGTRIVQWYGAHDKKPDKDNMQKWLDAYVTRLKMNSQPKATLAAV